MGQDWPCALKAGAGVQDRREVVEIGQWEGSSALCQLHLPTTGCKWVLQYSSVRGAAKPGISQLSSSPDWWLLNCFDGTVIATTSVLGIAMHQTLLQSVLAHTFTKDALEAQGG